MWSDPFLHDQDDFDDLILVVSGDSGIPPQLVEKDYWMMHCLFGLTAQGLSFHLKGGTSLSSKNAVSFKRIFFGITMIYTVCWIILMCKNLSVQKDMGPIRKEGFAHKMSKK